MMTRLRLRATFFSAVLLVSLLACAPAKGKTVTVTGKLVQVAAIGGETTGWAIVLERSIRVHGETLAQIEIEPCGKPVASLVNVRVRVTGTLESRRGIERKSRWVIRVKRITPIISR